MSDGFWVAAYVLAGVITEIIAWKVFLSTFDESLPEERREMELMFTALDAQPAAKVLLAVMGWMFWPLIAGWLLVFGVLIGLDEVKWQWKKRR